MQNRQSLIAIISWCLYDWACASFAVIVMTFIFAIYFTSKVAINPVVGTYQWANASALAGIIIAFLSPVMGAVADYGGYHKAWLFFFSVIAVICTALLWFAYPSPHYVYYTLACVVIGTIGYEVGLVFYNSFLGDLAPKSYLGRISGWGWGSGYLGGICALTIALVFFVKSNTHLLDTATSEHIRICGPFSALWFAIFALPLFFFVQSKAVSPKPLTQAVSVGCRELWKTIKQLPKDKNIFIYLISHMIYTDGLNTLFTFGGIYAAGTYGLNFEEVLLFGISMNIIAGIGAIVMGWMDDFLGSKFTVMLSLIVMTLLGTPLLFLHSKYLFWFMALLVCIFVGPVQSASRTLMVRLMRTRNLSTEMFGLYSLSGRITAFIGPWILGELTLLFNSQRVGMSVIMAFFALGAMLLIPVKAQE